MLAAGYLQCSRGPSFCFLVCKVRGSFDGWHANTKYFPCGAKSYRPSVPINTHTDSLRIETDI